MTPHCRSYLFVPGDRPERFDKALAAGADAIVIDLEDAVAPPNKTQARAAVADWLSAKHLTAEGPVIVRINGAETPWFQEDLALCAHAGVAAVMLPKAERIEEVLAAARTSADERRTAVLPLIETAVGFSRAQAIAVTAGVQRLAFGAIDFQLDLGIHGDDEELLFFRSQLVLASRLAGIEAPIDGVCTALDDAQRLGREATRARRLGFGAKLCIHPRQVEAVNRAFSPGEDEIAWAQRVLQSAAGNGGAVAVDGKMVDRPVILRAEAIVREAQRNKTP